MNLNRRSLITGLISLVAAPAIVRAQNIMPVKQMIEPIFNADEITFTACGEPSVGNYVISRGILSFKSGNDDNWITLGEGGFTLTWDAPR